MQISDELLPSGWMRVKLPEISDIVLGQSPPGTTYNENREGLPFFQGNADFGKIHPKVRVWCSAPRKIAHSNDILLSVRAPIGAINIADQTCAIGRGLTALIPKSNLLNQYLYHYLFFIREDLERMGRGSTFTSITKDDLINLTVPLPPLYEQKRIVAKIEKLLARVDATKDRLDRVPAIMQQFRQSVLAAACSGRLTEDWLGEPHSNNNNNKKIPDEWKSVKIKEVCHSRLGKMLDKEKNQGEPVPYLRNIDVRWGTFDFSDIKTIKATDREIHELTLNNGDILVCEGGEPGRCAIWRETEKKFIFQKALHRLRVYDTVIPDWICINLKEAADSGRLSEFFTGSTIKHLTGVSLKEFSFLLPPLSEQQKIADRINSVFSIADRVDERVKLGKELVDNITQSILHQAFTGKIVPTNEGADS